MGGTDKLSEAAARLGIDIPEESVRLFHPYTELLLEWNEKINLTAITDPEDIRVRHYLDSLTLLLSGKAQKNCSMIDIGAGAGFPSLPVKLVRPDIEITMLDSLGKRVDFLNRVTDELGLTGIKAVHLRAEDGARTPLRESFDLATARAVASLSVLAEYALPYVKPGGCFVAMKGTAPEEEIREAKPAVKTLGGEIEEVKKIHIPDGGLDHTLIIIKKVGITPAKYPRKAGTPSKSPLK